MFYFKNQEESYDYLQAEHILKLLWSKKHEMVSEVSFDQIDFFVILFIQLKAVCSVTVHCLLRDDHTELRVLLNCTHFERGGVCFGGKFYNIMILKKNVNRDHFMSFFMTHKDLCSACKSAYLKINSHRILFSFWNKISCLTNF